MLFSVCYVIIPRQTNCESNCRSTVVHKLHLGPISVPVPTLLSGATIVARDAYAEKTIKLVVFHLLFLFHQKLKDLKEHLNLLLIYKVYPFPCFQILRYETIIVQTALYYVILLKK